MDCGGVGVADASQASFIDNRNFQRGDIFEVEFPSGRGSFVMEGKHMAVVLYNCIFPRKTVVVAPITSLYKGDGTKKHTIDTDIELPDSENYLTKHSMVKIEQLTCVDRKALGDFKGAMSVEYLAEVSLATIELLELEDVIELMVEERMKALLNAEAKEKDLA